MIRAIGNSNNYMNFLQQSPSTQNKWDRPDVVKALDTGDSGGIRQSMGVGSHLSSINLDCTIDFSD